MTIDFPLAFAALTGRERPLRWQERLFAAIDRGDIPAACDIPTGLGKTSVIAIWLVALDLGARGGRLPRRLVYVVDRRAVVDQATAEAQQLADALGDGNSASPIISAMRKRLGLGPGNKLPVSTLRGQFADNRKWLDDPSSPAIIVGTVDMIGSRLLFQGYGVSRGRRPVHAALLGSDALIVLDEAHLVPPFQALAEQVADLTADDRERAPFRVPSMRVMTLSATGRGTASKTFTLEQEDEEKDEIIRARLNAPKWLRLEALPETADLADAMADRAWERGQDGSRVLVFCNSRKVASQIHENLAHRLRELPDDKLAESELTAADLVQLMVGARRVREREVLTETHVFKRFSPATAKIEQERANGLPAYLAASAAGEVGVDADSDHMICDLVAWERMVQRLGRVNRLGELREGSLVDVFFATSDEHEDSEIPADESRIKKYLAPFEAGPWTINGDRRLASPGALRLLRQDPEFEKRAADATTSPPLRPAVTRPLVDAWSMTALDEHPGRPGVAPWIRGWVGAETQTKVLWRKYLPFRTDDGLATATKIADEFLDAAPPHLTEILETETSYIVDMLRARAKALLKDRNRGATESDNAALEKSASAAGASDANDNMFNNHAFVAVALASDRKVERLLRLSDLAELDAKRLHRLIVGRTLVLDARMGGLAHTGLLQPKEDGAPATLDQSEDARDALAGLLWDEERLRQIGFRVRRVERDCVPDHEWRISYRRFVTSQSEEADENGTAQEWRVEDWVGGTAAHLDPALAKAEQFIDDHHQQAAVEARRICTALDLPVELLDLVVLTASIHDLGKMRSNWQAYAGNYGYPRQPLKPRPLAKFKIRGNPRLLKIGEITYRHEFGSLHDAQNGVAHLDEDARDLLFHMIAAHHGNARPVIPPIDQNVPPSASVELACEAARRFVRLQRRWGSWGLAWLEALLRAADVAASREANAPKREAS